MEKHLLLKELQSRHEFPEEEFPKLMEFFEERNIKKNEILFHTGEVVKYCYFVLKGCLQQYYISPGGIEKIIYFSEEGAWMGEMDSMVNETPSIVSALAVEDSEVLVMNKTNWEYTLRNIPDFALYHIKKRGHTIARMKQQLAHSTTTTPDQKYRQLLNETPDLLQRLPLYKIASYLGVTPETLSRIRKRNTRL